MRKLFFLFVLSALAWTTQTKAILIGPWGDCALSFVSQEDPASPNGVYFYAFNVSTGATPTNIQWSFGDGNFGEGAETSHFYEQQGVYNVCIFSTDSLGAACVNGYCAPVAVGVPLPLSCQAGFLTSTQGNTVSFLNTSNTANTVASYSWNFGDGTASADSNPTHEYAPGVYTACLDIVTADGCFSSYCDVVYPGNIGVDTLFQCYASMGYEPSIPAPGANNLAMQFYNYSYSFYENYTVLWDFGDGYTSNEMNPLHEYATEGTYNVCISILGGVPGTVEFCSDQYCLEVQVPYNPYQGIDCFANMTIFPLDSISNTGYAYTYQFIDASYSETPIISWSWDFGDGNTSTEQNPTHTYATDGEFWANLSITSESGCQNALGFVVYAGNYYPYSYCQASFGYYGNYWASPDSTITNINELEVQFYDYSYIDLGVTAWAWDFGDGTTSTDQNPLHEYAAEGEYNVCLTVEGITYNNETCSNTYCYLIEVPYNPYQGYDCIGNATYTPIDTNPNTGAAYTFQFTDGTYSETPIISWNWDFGDGNASTEQNPTHTYTTDGSYIVVLTTTSENGCQGYACIFVYVGEYIYPSYCYASFGYYTGTDATGLPSNLTDSLTVQFYDYSYTDNGVSTWAWDFGDGTLSTEANPVHTYLIVGDYNVCLTITGNTFNGDTCTNQYCQLISVPYNPYAGFDCYTDFTYTPINADPNGSVNTWQFTDNSYSETPIISWAWDFGDGTTSNEQNPVHTYAQEGSYLVILTTTSENGCSGYWCLYINSGYPIPVFEEYCSAYFGYGQGFGIDSTNIGGGNPENELALQFYDYSYYSGTVLSWNWDFGDGTTSTEQNPHHEFASEGTYNICLSIVTVATDWFTQTTDTCTNQYCEAISVPFVPQTCFASFYSLPNTQTALGIPNTLEWTFFDASWSYGAIASWSWDFGDGTTSTEQNPSHTYAVEGNYNVCLTINANNADGTELCSNQYCTLLFASEDFGPSNGQTTSICGYIANTDSLNTTSLGIFTAYLIAYDANAGTLTLIDSVQGTDWFSFFDVPAFQSYLIKVALGTESPYYSQYLPTYYSNALTWDEATAITPGFADICYPIFMQAGENPGGPGFIEGNISEGAGKIEGEGMSGVTVILLDESGNPVAYTYTDSEGNYSFTNIPYGNYWVEVDAMHFHCQLRMVTVGIQTETTTLNYSTFGNNLVLNDVINDVIEAVIDPQGIVLDVLPSPVQNSANLSIIASGNIDNAQLRISTVRGQNVFSRAINITTGSNLVPFDASNYTPGIYIATLQVKGKIIAARKFTKQ